MGSVRSCVGNECGNIQAKTRILYYNATFGKDAMPNGAF